MAITAPAPVPVGVGFTPFEDRLDVMSRIAVHAEARGMAFVSVAEAMSLAAPIVLARLADRTDRIEADDRGPVGLESHPGDVGPDGRRTATPLRRGASPSAWALARRRSPRASMGNRGRPPSTGSSRPASAVRALLQGERLPATPAGARPLPLGRPPVPAVPIAMAAITAPGIRLAGVLADQWLPFLLPPAGLDDGRELIAAVATERPSADAPTVTAAVPVALAGDEETAARIAARWLITYATKMGPVYPRVLRAHGYRRELDALLEANSDARQPVLPSSATRLAHDLLVFGTYDDAPALCRRWHAHADTLALVAPFGVTADDLAATIDAVARGPGAHSDDGGGDLSRVGRSRGLRRGGLAGELVTD